MVVKRQCAFCAGEIEPGRGLMYVKRDGSVFYFCSGTCRKHQVTYHRVGHRLRWTRAHSLRKLSTRVSTPIPKAVAKAAPPPPAEVSPPPPSETAAPPASVPKAGSEPASEGPAATRPSPSAGERSGKAPRAGTRAPKKAASPAPEKKAPPP